MPTIEEWIAANRRRLMRRESAMIADLEKRYEVIIEEAVRRAEAATALAARRVAAGQSPLSALLTNARFENLADFIEEEWRLISDRNADLVNRERRQAILAAADDFAELLASQDVRAAIDPQAIERMAGAIQPPTPVHELFSRLAPDAAERARQALLTGVALGDNPVAVGRRLGREMRGERSRANTIARTEVLRAYRGSMRQRMNAARGTVSGYVWVSARDRRTCAMCWAMHGTIHSLDEEFATHPNCRCSQAPLSRTTQVPVQNGEAEFARLPEAMQRAILGPGKYRAYSQGRITLRDLVGERQDPRWGHVRFERSLRSAGGGNIGGITVRPPPPPPPPRPAPPPRPRPVATPRPGQFREINTSPIGAALEKRFQAIDHAMRSAVTPQQKLSAAKRMALATKAVFAKWGYKSGWNGQLRAEVMDYAAAYKDWDCSIAIGRDTLRNATPSRLQHTVIHEMAHSIGGPLNTTIYDTGAKRLIEEAATETFARQTNQRLVDLGALRALGSEFAYEQAVYVLNAIANKQNISGQVLAQRIKQDIQLNGIDWDRRMTVTTGLSREAAETMFSGEWTATPGSSEYLHMLNQVNRAYQR